MINRSLYATLLMAFACISAPLSADNYHTIPERQDAVIVAYVALIQKWSPALDNPSDATIKLVIGNKRQALQAQMDNAFCNGAAQKEIKAVMDDLKNWTMEFICNELDTDIKTVFELRETARILNMEININSTPFQELRAALDTLPCMERELQERATFTSRYKNYVLPGFGLVLGWYASYSIMKHYNISFTPVNTAVKS